MMERISIIVPVYKTEAYLDRCVQSIVEQSYRNLEIILVDDGSPDNCPALCDAWAEKDPRIKVVHKKNGGLSDARNAGMAVASGELMGFVDSDDWIAPDMYQHLYDRMIADNSDLVACGVEMVWEDGSTSRSLTKPGRCVLNREEAMQAIIQESWLKQPVWYKLYKTALIRDIPFPVGKYHEDVFWSYQAISRAKSVSVFDTPCYFYMQRSTSIMGEGYSLKRLQAIEAKVLRLAFIQKNFPELEKTAKVNLLFSCLYSGQMSYLYLTGEDRAQAIESLKRLIATCGFQRTDFMEQKLTNRCWAQLAVHDFRFACRLRNILRVGF